MPRLFLIIALSFWSLVVLADPPTTEDQLANYHDDCLASMQVLDYGPWRAQRICDCSTEHLEEVIRSPAKGEPQDARDTSQGLIGLPDCL